MAHQEISFGTTWSDKIGGGLGVRVIAKIFSHWLGLFDLTVTNNILTNPHMVKALLVV